MTATEDFDLTPENARQLVREAAAELISAPCTAECGYRSMWRPGQKWLRCINCETMQYWPEGAHK